MARRRRRTSSGLPPRAAQAAGRALRWAWEHPQPVLMLAVVAAGLGGAWWAVTGSDAFRVATVTFAPAEMTFDVPNSVIGRRLWDVDVDGLARQLKTQRPSMKQVRVVRLLPDALQIESVPRTAVAQVRAGNWYAVDADGYVLPEASAAPNDQLVVLKGIENARAPLRAGQRNGGEPMGQALRLLARLRRAPELAGHRLSAIDVSDPAQLSFVMDDGVEVRCGSEEELAAHLDRLRRVLKQVASHALSVRYIDVRFQDPVIAPRT